MFLILNYTMWCLGTKRIPKQGDYVSVVIFIVEIRNVLQHFTNYKLGDYFYQSLLTLLLA